MATAEIGALRVRLGMDAGEFRKGAKDAEGTLDRLGARFDITSDGMKKAGLAMGAALAAAGVAVAHSIKAMLTEVDKIGKMAQSMGIPVEQLSRLKLAADLSDVSLEQLGTAVGKLSRSMQEMAGGDKTSAAARSFAALGITATTAGGQLKSTDAIMLEVADKFKRMDDGAGKTALAMNIFGRSGAALIPMLNSGADGLRDMMKEADELGVTFNSRTAKAAEEFNDTLTRVNAAKDGMVMQIIQRLLPSLQALADRFLSASKDGDTMKAVTDGVANAFSFLARTGSTVVFFFTRLAAEIIAVKQALEALFSGEGFGRARDIMAEAAAATETARASLNSFNAEIVATTSGMQVMAGKAGEEFPNKVAAPIVQSTQAMAEAMKAFRDQQKAAFEDIVNADTATFVEKMRAAEQAVRNGTITMSEFGRVTRKIQKENAEHMGDLASASANALTTIFKDSKAAAIASAIINTAQGITKNLATYPQPYAGIMAGITAATGAAQIAAIRSTSEKGGGGGAPSASSASAAPAMPEMQQTLVVQGISPSQMFSGDAVRDLANRLVEYQRDGGTVVIQ